MSKIYINEVDLTTVESTVSEGVDIVYIPGFSTALESDSTADVKVPTLCRSVAEFNNLFGTYPATFVTDQSYPTGFDSAAIPKVGAANLPMFNAGDPDPSYIYAKELLALGIPVVYERINDFGEDNISVADMYSYLSTSFSQSTDCTSETTVANSSISVTSSSTFSSIYNTSGSYVFTAIATLTPSVSNITEGSATVDYDTYINYNNGAYKAAGAHEFSAVISNASCEGVTSITGATIEVNTSTFRSYNNSAYSTAGSYVFTYDSENSTWVDEDETEVNLVSAGITLTVGTGTLTNNSTITITVSYTVSWKDSSNNIIVLKDLGITLVGTPKENSKVIINVGNIDPNGAVWKDTLGVMKTLSAIGISFTTTGTVVANDTITVDLYYSSPIISDKNIYNIKYITTGGYPSFEYNGKSISQAMATLAANRGDCIALIDHTNNASRDLIGINSVYSHAKSNTYILSSSSSSYAAMFTPYCNYVLNNDYSNLSINTFSLPASFAYLSCLANSIQSNPSWLAIAGASRGKVISLYSVNTSKIITNSIADNYQSDDSVCINPITNIRPYGQCIWGNRTLVDNSIKGGTTAISFLNIRNLACDIKKQLYVACQSLLFDQNSDVLWNKFLSLVMPLLDKMITGYGIQNYRIIRTDPSDRSMITAIVRIYPIYAVESFDLTVVLQNGNSTVEE